ncbi:hypothetical protein P3T76_010247 [Phytophthora citrophthora]|uniref:Uncharacterized protein n=1 Tax=Phytophthora citrophthora TaxID=4793 RepID=A0AAD9GC13_9STRA|nr:hypothetical protein P3T76_010247 [Phytophthora citrophthora]
MSHDMIMNGDSQTLNTDFLQDLDMWLLQGGLASPAMTRHSLDVNAANAAIPSPDAALLAPTAPIPSSDKTQADNSFVAALTDDMMPWTALSAKAKAEVENVKLREMVQSQMRLVKSFERLLRKRKIWDQLQEKNASAGEESRKEEEVLEEMEQDVDSRYPHVDKMLNENGLGEADPAVNVGDDANMKYSPTEGMYLEYKEKKYMPFDYKTLDDVVWRSFGEGKLKLEDSQLTILKSTDEMLYSRTVLPLSKKASNAIEIKEVVNSVGLSVMKRFTEDNRLKYVWFSKTSVKRPGDNGDSPVLLVQKGCAVLEPATLPDGSPGCAIRSYTSSVPTLAGQPSGDDQEAQHREVGVLTEMVFAAYQQSRQSINQTLENLVLDEMMAKNAASTPTTSIADTDVSV